MTTQDQAQARMAKYQISQDQAQSRMAKIAKTKRKFRMAQKQKHCQQVTTAVTQEIDFAVLSGKQKPPRSGSHGKDPRKHSQGKDPRREHCSNPQGTSTAKKIKFTRHLPKNKRQVQIKSICSQQQWQHKRKRTDKIAKITKSVCSQQQWHPKAKSEQG
jgi:hypothetical protein